jgi:hypothetical protein
MPQTVWLCADTGAHAVDPAATGQPVRHHGRVALVRIPPATGLPERSAHLAVGAGTWAITLVDRATGGSGRTPALLDAAIGVAAITAETAARTGTAVGQVLAPVVRVAARPPLVPDRFAPGRIWQSVLERGRLERALSAEQLDAAVNAAAPALVPAVLDEVLDQIDLTQLVIERVDLNRVVTSALDTLDLTQVVLTRVDLERIINTALDGLDLNEVVRTRVDLVGIAEEVIDAIDLPEIIRESSGGVATEAVRGVRMQSIEVDEAVQGFVDRVLRRKHERDSEAVKLDDEIDHE